jgi:DNA-binding response OmpR family regulator
MSPGPRPLPARGGQRILVVDDDRRVVELLQVALSANGFQVVCASNGEDALKVAVREQPDLVVLDVRLPRKSGFEVCEVLRHDPEDSGVPIILVSAMGETEMRVEGLARGADDFLAKPFSPKELVARIRRLLQRSEEQREVRLRNRALDGELVRAREESRRLSLELRRERGMKDTLLGLGRDLHRALDGDAVAQALLLAAQSKLGVGSAGLMVPAPGASTLRMACARGAAASTWERLELPTHGELARLVAGLARPVRRAELERFSEVASELQALTAAGVALLAPLMSVRGLEALLLVDERASGEDFQRADLDALAVLAEAGAVALHDALRFEESQGAWLAVVAALADEVEARAGKPARTRRVAALAALAAAELGLDAAEAAAVQRAAWLRAARALLPDPRDAAADRAAAGSASAALLLSSAEGLTSRRGELVPQILAAAECWEALRAEAVPCAEARERLEREAGLEWDGEVARAVARAAESAAGDLLEV